MSSISWLPNNISDFRPALAEPASLPLVEEDELIALLEKAAESELDGLVKCLIAKGGVTCQLGRLEVFKDFYPQHRIYLRDIAAEIQKFGANTIATQLFRSGKGVEYKEIVNDVAVRVGVARHGSVAQIEGRIHQRLMQNLWKDMNSAERKVLLREFDIYDASLALRAVMPLALIEATKLTGFAAYKASVIVANIAAYSILGHGLAFTTNTAISKSLSLLLGPIAIKLAAAYAINSIICSEAYRVTIPCVIQISMIRHAVSLREPKTKISNDAQTNKLLDFFIAAGAIAVVILAISALISK
jgi:uncharacterized protein YaaW (UPF0174 family)